jgi:hypothetical protein
VYKVKRSLGKRLAENVVTPHLQVGRVDSVKEMRLKVGRDNSTTVPPLGGTAIPRLSRLPRLPLIPTFRRFRIVQGVPYGFEQRQQLSRSLPVIA